MGDAAVANMPPPRPQQHYQESPQASPQFVGMSSNDVASKVVDAYKTSPLLTGLLLLNLIIFVGAGYYLNVVQDRTYNYIKDRDAHEHERTQKTFDMLKSCVVPDAPRYAPQPYYPQFAPAPEHPQYTRPIQPVPPSQPVESPPAALPPRQTPRTVTSPTK